METKGDYRILPVLDSGDLLALATKIKGGYPYSISTYNNLLMNARDCNRDFQYKFYVPEKYPDSHIVIWEKKVKPYCLSFHCREEETPLLLRIIQDAQFLPFLQEDPVEVYHIPDYLLDPMHGVLQAHQKDPINKFPNFTFAYVSPQNYPLRCPAGMRVRRLGKTGVRHLLQYSKFNHVDSVDHVCHLADKTAALGVYLDSSATEDTNIDVDNIGPADPEDDLPVAWIGTYHYGTFGMLQTSDNYRRRGLGSLLTELMGRLHVAQGLIPHASVERDNEVSANMFRKLPGWSDTYCSWWLSKDDGIPTD